MSNGELVAWSAGVSWYTAGRTVNQYAAASVATIAAACGGDASEAVQEMGRDIFSHWFVTGWFDAHTARVD